MSKTVKTTRLGQIQTALGGAYLEALKGEPLRDSEGNLIVIDGKPLLGPPDARILKEAREYLKDMGITEEPEDAECHTVYEVAKAVTRFEADQDELLNQAALQIEEKKGT
jgi:hypothetical protein